MKKNHFLLCMNMIVCFLAVGLMTFDSHAQPVFNDPRLGCTDAACGSTWTTAMRQVDIPSVSSPCKLFVTYKWRLCGGKREILIDNVFVLSPFQFFPWRRNACGADFYASITNLVNDERVLDDIKVREFYKTVFDSLVVGVARQAYNDAPEQFKYLFECGGGNEQTTYEGFFGTCFARCLSFRTVENGEIMEVDHIPCSESCCTVTIQTCWQDGQLITTRSITTTSDPCQTLVVPEATCTPGEENYVSPECINFCE